VAEAGRLQAVLTAYRWVAFAGPRTTTGPGVLLLVAVVAPQVSLLATADYPAWLDAWFVLAGVLTLVAAAALTAARSRLVAGLGWGVGSLVCATSIGLWVASVPTDQTGSCSAASECATTTAGPGPGWPAVEQPVRRTGGPPRPPRGTGAACPHNASATVSRYRSPDRTHRSRPSGRQGRRARSCSG
jgi:hypothetical protein